MEVEKRPDRKSPSRKDSCISKDKLTKSEAIELAKSLSEDGIAKYNAYKCYFNCKLPCGSTSWHVDISKKSSNYKPSKESSCSGKDKLTMYEAIERAKSLEQKYKEKYTAYKCHYSCKLPKGTIAWHVGHTRKSKKSQRVQS